MILKTEAIVLNKIKYNDSAYIANLYSLEYGRLAVLLRIPKTNKTSVKPNLFFPLNVIQTELTIKSARSIQTIKHCNALFPVYNICTDIYKSSIAQFIAEIISKTVKEQESNPEMYAFIKQSIEVLENIEIDFQNLHIVFLKEFANFLGFAITNNFSHETPYFNLTEGLFLPMFTNCKESLNEDESKVFAKMLTVNYSNVQKVNLTYKQRRMLIDKLLFYYKIHIDSLADLNSIEVLHEVFSD